jgi:hypothetical protein
MIVFDSFAKKGPPTLLPCFSSSLCGLSLAVFLPASLHTQLTAVAFAFSNVTVFSRPYPGFTDSCEAAAAFLGCSGGVRIAL